MFDTVSLSVHETIFNLPCSHILTMNIMHIQNCQMSTVVALWEKSFPKKSFPKPVQQKGALWMKWKSHKNTWDVFAEKLILSIPNSTQLKITHNTIHIYKHLFFSLFSHWMFLFFTLSALLSTQYVPLVRRFLHPLTGFSAPHFMKIYSRY